MKWYVLVVKSGSEIALQRRLHQYNTYSPTYKDRDKTPRALFKGYLFVAMGDDSNWHEPLEDAACYDYIRFNNMPAKISDEDIERLKLGEEAYNQARKIKKGAEVEITDGVFKLYRGIVQEKVNERITILLGMANNMKIDITTDSVKMVP